MKAGFGLAITGTVILGVIGWMAVQTTKPYGPRNIFVKDLVEAQSGFADLWQRAAALRLNADPLPAQAPPEDDAAPHIEVFIRALERSSGSPEIARFIQSGDAEPAAPLTGESRARFNELAELAFKASLKPRLSYTPQEDGSMPQELGAALSASERVLAARAAERCRTSATQAAAVEDIKAAFRLRALSFQDRGPQTWELGNSGQNHLQETLTRCIVLIEDTEALLSLQAFLESEYQPDIQPMLHDLLRKEMKILRWRRDGDQLNRELLGPSYQAVLAREYVGSDSEDNKNPPTGLHRRAFMARLLEASLPALECAPEEASAKLKASLAMAEQGTDRSWRYLNQAATYPLSRTYAPVQVNLALTRLFAAAVGAQAFCAKGGRWPKDLEEAGVDHLLDPFIEKPFLYKADASGITISSGGPVKYQSRPNSSPAILESNLRVHLPSRPDGAGVE